jgi:hypothetical protein
MLKVMAGQEERKKVEREDAINDLKHNSKCPPNNSDFWCAMYKLGHSAARYFANNFIIPFAKAYGQEDRTEIKITIFTDDNVGNYRLAMQI